MSVWESPTVINVHSVIIGSMSKSVFGTQRFSLRLRPFRLYNDPSTSHELHRKIFGAPGGIVIILCIPISYFVVLKCPWALIVMSAKVTKKVEVILPNYVASFVWLFVSPFTGNLNIYVYVYIDQLAQFSCIGDMIRLDRFLDSQAVATWWRITERERKKRKTAVN